LPEGAVRWLAIQTAVALYSATAEVATISRQQSRDNERILASRGQAKRSAQRFVRILPQSITLERMTIKLRQPSDRPQGIGVISSRAVGHERW